MKKPRQKTLMELIESIELTEKPTLNNEGEVLPREQEKYDKELTKHE